MSNIDKNESYSNKTFEDIKHIDENGIEYWYARELMKVLSYKDWRYFDAVIEKAKIACQNSEIADIDHFVVDNKMVEIGSGAKREQKDYKLTRYACYLIAQNANPRLKIVALAQTYFAIQTRKQEISEKEYNSLTEDEKRFYQRNLTRKGNYSLNQTAKNAGVKNFDKFHNSGYKGLYNGETANDIAKRKGLRYREDILDNMGSDELIANLFRISQTEQKLKKDNIQSEKEANETHYNIGKNIREVIAKNGGTMPENLPTPKKSLKQLEKENKRSLKNVEMKMIKEDNKIMELWEVLDDKGNATGEIMEKYDQKVFDRGFYHLGADVWIINSDNKILIQKRAKQKKLEPNVWAMTGGSVIKGENSINTIVREAKEELDIDINVDDLKLITKFKTGNVWIYTYILKSDYDIAKMKFQEDEVSDVKWATWTEINDLVYNGQFIKHRWEFVSGFLKEEIE